MSEIKINPIPIGIPIRYSKSWHSFSNPQGGVQKYLFELTINYDSTNKKIFRKIESDKHCDLIEQEDNIKYNEVKNFKLSISKLPSDTSFNYETEGLINQDHTFYNKSENEIYIEFSQNSSGNTFCRSSFVGVDFTKICVSPPN